MAIIDHLSVGVSSIEAACRFYDDVLAPLGCQRLVATGALAAYGAARVEFVVILPFDGEPATGGNGTHICFAAPSPAAVDAFYHSAMAKGATDEGAPGPRPGYPKADVYAAFVRDPFGNKLEAIHNGFAS